VSPPPEDGRMPTFLILGTAKAGTTSLYQHLRHHPQAFMPRIKEPNFFAFAGEEVRFTGPGDEGINERSVTRLDDYRTLFAGAEGARARGEASTLYLYHPRAAERIALLAPRARLIAVLRDPADRAYSAWLHLRRGGREPLASFAAALDAEPARIAAGWQHLWHYAAMGFYALQLRRYLARFRREQILVLRFERFAREPRRVLSQVAGFLGLDDAFTTPPEARHARSGIPRSRTVHRLLLRAGPLRALARGLLSAPRAARLHERLEDWLLVRPPLDPDLRARLAERFRDDVLETQDLIGEDLSGWLSVPREGGQR
jgi:hypothetical protein